MISDINHILNFRFNPRQYLSWDWNESVDNNLYIQRTLQELPKVFDHFKLVIHINGHYVNDNAPSNDVFCMTRRVQNLSSAIKNSKLKSLDSLVCCGSDRSFSLNLNALDQIQSKFNKIYYEAKDVECDWVQTLPMGMTMAYMIRNGGNDILKHINKQKNKTKLVASAFGRHHPQLTERISDRSELKNFTSNSDFMDDMFCEPTEFYANLCDYRFFASALGNGLQTPKICECIMCETVPVVTDHVVHRELRDIYGLPLLIVHNWSDLTEEFLNEQWDLAYSKVDWNLQKSKFLVKNFSALLQNNKFHNYTS